MIRNSRLTAILLIGLCLTVDAGSGLAVETSSENKSSVVSGWHEWYEIKADPQQQGNIMVCGNGWDSMRNALYGFVAISTDRGKSWHTTFEDRSTRWVSEQSCAFGPNHTAYLISDASLVIDDKAYHHLGSTHLFVSNDGGEHWAKTIETGWTDYSTSAVSSSTGELVTFYNHGVFEPGRKWGTSIGAIVFSRDGKRVRGAFFDPRMKEQNYRGNLPSQATAMPDGSVAGLYTAVQSSGNEAEYVLGFSRLELGDVPRMRFTQIASMSPRCFDIDGHALSYDSTRKLLIVAYGDESPEGCGLGIATSADEGKTWDRHRLLNSPLNLDRAVRHLAAAVSPDGVMGLLWEYQGGWLFSSTKDLKSMLPVLELSRRPKTVITTDSLMTFVFRTQDSEPAALINVRSNPTEVLRSGGLIAVGGHFKVVIPMVSDGYEKLEAMDVQNSEAPRAKAVSENKYQVQRDVTSQVVLLTDRAQSFDPVTGILTVNLRLANRGDRPLFPPIRVEARELRSEAGAVTIANSDNNVTGAGAIWDISRTITGSELIAGATADNTFLLKFHVALERNRIPTDHLVDLKVRVVAAASNRARDR